MQTKPRLNKISIHKLLYGAVFLNGHLCPLRGIWHFLHFGVALFFPLDGPGALGNSKPVEKNAKNYLQTPLKFHRHIVYTYTYVA